MAGGAAAEAARWKLRQLRSQKEQSGEVRQGSGTQTPVLTAITQDALKNPKFLAADSLIRI